MLLKFNGSEVDVPVAPHETLLTVLRDRLSLTGAKAGCERGECGTCTVLIDGRPVYSCLTFAAGAQGADIVTIEGIGTPTELHPVQQAFVRNDAAQCGFCTPGQVLAAIALLDEIPSPTDDEIAAAMSGNLCRCGTYQKIKAAIRDAAGNPAP
jgi:aerobic-type carbon monoxide dehydrogenase small subunit (CoxS/CutS family)